MKNDALATTTQVLAITSNLLAIFIETGIIVGGIYICKKISEPEQKALPEQGVVLVPVEKKLTLKERFHKAKNIVKAVTDK